jgi:hypothetical protein
MMKLRLYVAGPMTGLPGRNYDAFRTATRELTDTGYTAIDPSEIDALHEFENARQGCKVCRRGTHSWHWYMKRAIGMMVSCDGVATLPGWENSKGAKAEVELALMLEMPVASVDTWSSHFRKAIRSFIQTGEVNMS